MISWCERRSSVRVRRISWSVEFGKHGERSVTTEHPNGLTKMPQPGGGATGTSASKDSKLLVHLVQLVKALNTSSFERRHRDVFCAAGLNFVQI